MPKILLAGNDFRLLGTRATVLGRIGASVVCCSAVEAFGVITTEKFDLVVLCHTLSNEDSDKIVRGVHQHWPQTRTLQILSDLWREPLSEGREPVLTSSPDPNRMIRCITDLLKSLPNHRIEEATSRFQESASLNLTAG